jgi:hypothetical protein
VKHSYNGKVFDALVVDTFLGPDRITPSLKESYALEQVYLEQFLAK